ncbi:hypothetical protein [Halorussus salinus]|uniref:hypothetical protein n=1 Tax=Halorussus salinus TaxID=1364935 RepID=UPI001091C201|nr:hypothetical protein [Halorussus salinus]
MDYAEDSEMAHLELVAEYEEGMGTNRKVLYLNGFGLAVGRGLLALSVTVVVLGFVRHPVETASVASSVRTFIS